jgi:hypothetical protein
MTSNNPSMRELALAALARHRGTGCGTVAGHAEYLSQGEPPPGTAKSECEQEHTPAVPLSHALRVRDVGHLEQSGTVLGTPAGQRPPSPYDEVLDELRRGCPEYVACNRWQQCVTDADRFLGIWGCQAQALGWTPRDIFGLHEPPLNPHASYSRLSRLDAAGLVWILGGRRVAALSSHVAAIETRSGGVVKFRKASSH